MSDATTAAAALSARADQARSNKKMIADYYDTALNKKDFAAARAYIGATYTQHNPEIENGPEGLARFIEWAKSELPYLRVEFLRMIADGDFVVMHNRGNNSPGTKAVVDIFRIDQGKVVEHWDVLQDVPAIAKNSNTMF
jgi:predicted SnoaL-like aldol condensation-catalyzing enzyme